MQYIVVTGAAGFIGSNLARRLNKDGFTNLILVDHFDHPAKKKNLEGISSHQKINRDQFISWFNAHTGEVSFIFHLGARTDTLELNFEVLDKLNLSYTKALWDICSTAQIPLLYASSAATYGSGEPAMQTGRECFSDDHALLKNLKPLNPYGLSKHLFDLYATRQDRTPPFWCGLKFFNVYGPYENHKARMASVIYHAYHQILETGSAKLFKSHRPDYKDGEQMRDFIYVDDVIDQCMFFFGGHLQGLRSGIYNAGSGTARSFNQLARAIFSSLGLPPSIAYIPTPAHLRNRYQYRTEACMDKLKNAGFLKKCTFLEDGIEKYTAFLKIF